MAAPWPGLQATREGCRLAVHVMPQARRTRVDGWHDGALRIRLAAPPVDGKANEALAAFVAGELELPRRAVQLLRGAASRHKQLAIDADVARIEAWLARVAPLPA
jgi:hypothetical protein